MHPSQKHLIQSPEVPSISPRDPKTVKNSKMVAMRRKIMILAVLIGLALAGCQAPASDSVRPTLQPVIKTAANNPVEPTLAPTLPAPTSTAMVLSEPIQLTATVWEQVPQVPILMYHRFDPRPGARSSRFTTSLDEFRQHLQTLYDAGFSLISLSDWLRGEIHLQEGRRPLIISIDDLFFADQISLDENGQPAPYSGVGVLWDFAQKHPDFNFHAALFYNLGDKGYANHYENGVFSLQDGWRQARAEAIAWAVAHGAMPMNHFYEHPYLDQLSPEEIQQQMADNDSALRKALALAGREDLNSKLPNILALPYVVLPDTDAGLQVLYDYVNPEGAPVAAIIAGDYAGGPRLLPAPFTQDYDRWHVSRISASTRSVAAIVERVDQIPAASHCELGTFRANPHILPEIISAAIQEKLHLGNCPPGYYVIGQLAFYVQEDEVIQYAP